MMKKSTSLTYIFTAYIRNSYEKAVYLVSLYLYIGFFVTELCLGR